MDLELHLKRDSDADVFLRIFWNFLDQFFVRKHGSLLKIESHGMVACLWLNISIQHNQDAVCLQAADISPGLEQNFSHGYFQKLRRCLAKN